MAEVQMAVQQITLAKARRSRTAWSGSRPTSRFEDETIERKPGGFVNLPAHQKRRVERTTADEPTIWLAVCYENVRRSNAR